MRGAKPSISPKLPWGTLLTIQLSSCITHSLTNHHHQPLPSRTPSLSTHVNTWSTIIWLHTPSELTLFGIEAVHSFDSSSLACRFVHSFQRTYPRIFCTGPLTQESHELAVANPSSRYLHTLVSIRIKSVFLTLIQLASSDPHSHRLLVHLQHLSATQLPSSKPYTLSHESYRIDPALDVTFTALLPIEIQLAKENGRGVAYATSTWHWHSQG